MLLLSDDRWCHWREEILRMLQHISGQEKSKLIVTGGQNPGKYNAEFEGGFRNGILTAGSTF